MVRNLRIYDHNLHLCFVSIDVAAGSCRCNVGMYSSFPHEKFQLASRWLIRLFSDLKSESGALKVIASISTEDFSTIFPPSTVKRIDRKKSMASL